MAGSRRNTRWHWWMKSRDRRELRNVQPKFLPCGRRRRKSMPETLVSLETNREGQGAPAQLRRVIICAGTGCMANGAMKVFEQFKAEMAGAGIHVILELRPEAGDGEVRLSKSGCQGFCQMGPLVSVVPDGILYTKVRSEDVAEIVRRTLVG